MPDPNPDGNWEQTTDTSVVVGCCEYCCGLTGMIVRQNGKHGLLEIVDVPGLVDNEQEEFLKKFLAICTMKLSFLTLEGKGKLTCMV